MTGKPETACEYPASLVVAMSSAMKRQMISDGAIKVGELHFAFPVRDEGGCPTELEGKLSVDGTWIDPKLRKDKTIWRLLKAMYGTQVASSRWQRLVRENTARRPLESSHKRTVCCIQ